MTSVEWKNLLCGKRVIETARQWDPLETSILLCLLTNGRLIKIERHECLESASLIDSLGGVDLQRQTRIFRCVIHF